MQLQVEVRRLSLGETDLHLQRNRITTGSYAISFLVHHASESYRRRIHGSAVPVPVTAIWSRFKFGGRFQLLVGHHIASSRKV
jgi:hypothetical protein